MSDPVPSRHRNVPDLEAAIVATELRLSERLAYHSWCWMVGRDTAAAENLARSAERRLELLWRERDWRLGHGQGAGG